MLSDIIEAGQVVEIEAVKEKNEERRGEESRKFYRTKVFDVLSEDQLEIMMPIEKGKVILLPVDEQFNMCFYTAKGLYQCYARILDRYKSNNVYIVVAELTSSLKKRQRREFYRLDCALEVKFRELDQEEEKAAESGFFKPNPLDAPLLKDGVVADISGGGMRFLSQYRCEVGALIYCTYKLMMKNEEKPYHLVGRVLRSQELEKRPGTYENRIQYVNMDVDAREEIIKYIFEEERRQRHKASNRK